MKTKTFEEYLHDIHAEDYHGTDDDMPDAFESWLENLDTSELMWFAQDCGNIEYHKVTSLIKSEIWQYHKLSPEFLKKYSIGIDEEKDINELMMKAHNEVLQNIIKTL